jgi:hypothetical protein
VVISHCCDAVIYSVVEGDDTGKGYGNIQVSLGDKQGRVNLNRGFDSVIVAAYNANYKDKGKQAYISNYLNNHVGLRAELVLEYINGQMLFAAINISTAKHNHPNKEVLGQCLGFSAGGIEDITGYYLVNNQNGHNAKSSGGENLQYLIQNEFDFI